MFIQWAFRAIFLFYIFPILAFGAAGWWGFFQTARRAHTGEDIFLLFDTVMMVFGMIIYIPYLLFAGDRFFLIKLEGSLAIAGYAFNGAPLFLGVLFLIERSASRRYAPVETKKTIITLTQNDMIADGRLNFNINKNKTK